MNLFRISVCERVHCQAKKIDSLGKASSLKKREMAMAERRIGLATNIKQQCFTVTISLRIY